jgi:hypothetical protein
MSREKLRLRFALLERLVFEGIEPLGGSRGFVGRARCRLAGRYQRCWSNHEIIQLVLKYEEFPDQAEASIRKSNDELHTAELLLNGAIERQEAIEVEMDTADDSDQAGLSERHQALDREINGLRQDYESADQSHTDNQTYWGF